MNISYSTELEEFASSVREFVNAHLSPITKRRVCTGQPLTLKDQMDWQDALARRGWLAGFWPKQFGGCGWDVIHNYVFRYETAYIGAPRILPFGVNYVGPVIYNYGTEEQKKRHLPGITENKIFWCQGYSEPNAGSDLAQLSTSAIRGHDGVYHVNGTKMWTTDAHWADWMFALVRTDAKAKPQKGISFILIDMRSPGISVKPIRTIEGCHHVNQVYFDDVVVPLENLIGEENRGWDYAKFLLGNERVLSADLGKIDRFLERLHRLIGDAGLSNDIRWNDKFHELEIDVLALKWLTWRMLDRVNANQTAGPEVAMLKIRGSELQQRITETTFDVITNGSVPAYDPDLFAANGGQDDENSGLERMGLTSEFLLQRVLSIWGGSNEIQKNIIAKRALCL